MLMTKGTDAHFVGPFKDLLTQFVKMKCSLGFSYVSPANILERFSKFTVTIGLKEPSLTKKVVLLWTKKRDWESESTWEARISNLRQFSLFLANLGYPAFVPICKVKIDRHNFVPYIFTSEELKHFFSACDTLPASKRTNKNILLPVLFRLLYSTGLRISEALELKLCDIDLTHSIITIRNGKGGKDRLIPISISLKLFMETLHSQLHQISIPQDYYFLKLDRTPLRRDYAYKRFRELLWRSGISYGGRSVGPRMHDFRHTFAVHSLRHMVKQGIDIYCALPLLSTYLGHASIAATEHYVRLTSEFFPEIITLVGPVSRYVIPEVYHETY